MLNPVFFDEVRVFSVVLTPNDVSGIYSFRGDTSSADLVLPCPDFFTCYSVVSRGIICSCPTNTYINQGLINSCYGNGLDQTTYYTLCSPCKALGDCVQGTYMSFVCDGSGTVSNQCLACDTGICQSLDYYKPTCSGTQNSICNRPYTVCPTGSYLKDATMYADGVCTPCTTCQVYNSRCEARKNAVCQFQCDNNVPCINAVSGQICVIPVGTSNGQCMFCPRGYSKQNNICEPCPPGFICDSLGTSLCAGVCPFMHIPQCSGGRATCTYNSECNNQGLKNPDDAYGLYTKFYIEYSCTAKKVCYDGYYTVLTLTREMVCTPCNPVASMYSVSYGLFMNDPNSCVYEPLLLNAGNKKGFYSINQNPCPWGYTSEQNNALTFAHCKRCPEIPSVYVKILDASLCIWVCIDGYEQVSDSCIYAFDVAGCDQEGMAVVDNKCVITPHPWQPAGYAQNNVYQLSEVTRVSPIKSIVLYNPLRWNVPGVLTVDFTYKQSYSNTEFNYMHVYTFNVHQQYNIKGKVCSLSVDSSRNMFYLAYCGVPAIFYLNPQTSSIKRLIGNSTSGYQEGMKNEALFEDELYVAYYTTNRLLVLDTLNCVLRDVVLGDDGPGDFRTKSYFIYGTIRNSQPLCVDLIHPRYLYPLSSSMIAFVHDTQRLCQFHSILKKVVCMQTFTIPSSFIGISTDDNGKKLVFEYSAKNIIYQTSGVVCPDDYTSIAGGSCSLYKPWKNGAIDGYYIQNGLAYPCAPVPCSLGKYSGKCTRTGPATCLNCVVNIGNNFVYTIPGSCEYSLTPPCPKNTYTNDQGLCIACPGVMFTRFYNGSSINDCICPAPLSKMGDNCVLLQQNSLFPMYIQNPCDFFHYFNKVVQRCVYCKENF